MDVRTLGFAMAVIGVALPGEAFADINCSADVQYYKAVCVYYAKYRAWMPASGLVGHATIDCDNNTTVEWGEQTECLQTCFAVCGGGCEPGKTCDNVCVERNATECVQPICPHESDLCKGAYLPDPDRAGWVLADHADGAYIADPAYSYNSAGAPNAVSNLSIGAYEVTFPKLAGGGDGNLQVVAYGAGASRCAVKDWIGDPLPTGPGDLRVHVACSAPDGSPVNATFLVNFLATDDASTGQRATGYLTYLAEAVLRPELLFSSSGPAPWIDTHHDGYAIVHFDGQSHPNPSAIVTALGDQGAFCQHVYTSASASGTQIGVFCFDSLGRLADTPFTLRYEWRAPPESPPAGYVVADKSTVASYAPAFQFNSAGQTNSASRGGTGSYSATYPGLAVKPSPTSPLSSNFMLTASAVGPMYCKIASWSSVDPAVVAATRCFNYRGGAADSQYVQVYSTHRSNDVVGP